jgi:multiple antibiotic resistance protein
MMPPYIQVFTFLFLMLGPFKILGPFTRLTQGATVRKTNRLALLAIIVSCITLLLAGVIGENILANFGIPLPILALAAGIILFLVALLNILHQFETPDSKGTETAPLVMSAAISPLAFPTIVTPYGIAAVIVFIALSPDLSGSIMVGEMVGIIMLINLAFMLINRYIFKVLMLILPILGAILGVVQVALGLKIIYNSLVALLAVK